MSTTKSDEDSYQDDSSDNSGAEPVTPPSDSPKRRGKFNSRRDNPEDSQESDSPLASLENNKFHRFRGGERKDKSRGYKKGGGFLVPKVAKEDRGKAVDRMTDAFAQEGPAV
jgi:hypothetical protein